MARVLTLRNGWKHRGWLVVHLLHDVGRDRSVGGHGCAGGRVCRPARRQGPLCRMPASVGLRLRVAVWRCVECVRCGWEGDGPVATLGEVEKGRQEGRVAQGGRRADDDELGLGTREGDVEAPNVGEQRACLARGIRAHEGEQHALIVAALAPVDRQQLDRRPAAAGGVRRSRRVGVASRGEIGDEGGREGGRDGAQLGAVG